MPAVKKRTLVAPVFVALLSVALVASLFYSGYLRCNYISFARFPVQGLDVSHHQGRIDWRKVKAGKFAFVFIKATEGGDLVDHEFRTNWVNARKNGFAVGAYHFFTFKKSGREQAKNFCNTVPIDDGSLPPVVDLEFMGNSSSRSSRAELHKELSDYITIVDDKYHRKPVLYTTYEFYDRYLAGTFAAYPVWIRDIWKMPCLIDNRKWTFWQYANRARIDGIGRYVDLNVFNGNEEEFGRLLGCADR